MLVSATEMLKKAKAGHYAVGQFNINNLEWTKAILQTAQECNSPVILGVSEGAGKYMTGYKTVVGMVNGMLEELNITVPVALHLDHGSYEGCLKCVEAGFSSIMFDGSHYPIEENVAKTKELVKIVAEHGMSLEAEVGSIGGEEDGVIGAGECADPKECKMIADLGVDFLAAGIGNIHGKYPANWKGLSFETLAAVQELTGELPLVLHGGTGIPADQIKKAIDLGVSKINVNTECQLAFADATRKYIEAGKDLEGKGFDPRKLLAPGAEAIKATVKEKMELFGLIGIKDIIDILIVATLLFYIYKIMKESGTLSIFLGVLAFIIVWFVASVFLKMELTGRILDKFMNIGLLILVILFQDQIKRFLVEIGSHQRWRFVHNLFRRRQTDEKPQASWILPIVYACLNMSKSKTGALIVIKGCLLYTSPSPRD